MVLSEPKLISPLLDNYAMGGAISTHDGVRCYPAMRENSDEKYIVKIISIPASQVQLDALLLSGAYSDVKAARAYFKELVNDIENEVEVLRRLSKLDGFLPYDGYQVVPMADGIGFDVYLVGSYKQSLAKYFQRKPMTHLSAINLGIDLCSAMSVCRQAGCLYIDLKPDNIYITEDGRYRVGDLGFIPLSSLKYASLPEKYRSNWTAPEVVDAFSSLNTTMDIYAIGLILYQAYNGGSLPFRDGTPADPFPAPMYADYEMADIILKACAPKPEDRWEDPKQLGQALVSYMQRNGANDTPIVPPVVPTPEPIPDIDMPSAEEQIDAALQDETDASSQAPDMPDAADPPGDAPNGSHPVQEAAADNTPAVEESPTSEESVPEELAFISSLVSDETAPSEENGVDIKNAVLTDELTDMLAQAEALIAHEAPAPAVAPEPIEVPMPAPIAPEPEEQPTSPEDCETVPESGNDDAPASEDTENAPTLPNTETALEGALENFDEQSGSRKRKRLIPVLISLLVIIAISLGGYYFYKNYYLQPIDNLELLGSNDHLTVRITTDANQSMLSVVCTDTYGNPKEENVVDGAATFTGLNPNHQYTIQVKTKGLHKLVGETEGTYSTPPKTEIVSFTAIAGSEDGSVILSFTVDGQEATAWNITYTAEGEEEKIIPVSGHMATITGLTLDKVYTFRLVPENQLFLVGTDQLEFTAGRIVCAENLTVTDCVDGMLTVKWNAPVDAVVNGWTVRCYNETGYNETVTTTECTATLSGVNTTTANTIEVTADGMTQCARTFITADPITITNVHGSNTEPTYLAFQWEFLGTPPEGGWLLEYSIDGSAVKEVIQCAENSAVVTPKLPGSHYVFTIQAASGVTVLGGSFSAEAPAADNFVGFGVSSHQMEFQMCKTPDIEDWNRNDLVEEDYKTEFTAGEKASFLVHLTVEYNVEYEDVTTLYIIRDVAGNLVSAQSQTRRWIDMWRSGYCELDIPSLPETAGEYTIEIYFNGAFVTTQNFKLK